MKNADGNAALGTRWLVSDPRLTEADAQALIAQGVLVLDPANPDVTYGQTPQQ
jgi:hypothetical protein